MGLCIHPCPVYCRSEVSQQYYVHTIVMSMLKDNHRFNENDSDDFALFRIMFQQRNADHQF